MDTTRSPLPLLSAENAAFIRSHTSLSVAARDAQNRPAIARGAGCSVSDDRQYVTVFLCPMNAGLVLKNLEDNGAIAMVATRPTTHAALQLKGKVTQIAAMTPAERELMEAHQRSFIAELGVLGYAPELIRALLGSGEDCLAVHFQPLQIFNQTPGPRAGEKLGGTA